MDWIGFDRDWIGFSLDLVVLVFHKDWIVFLTDVKLMRVFIECQLKRLPFYKLGFYTCTNYVRLLIYGCYL